MKSSSLLASVAVCAAVVLAWGVSSAKADASFNNLSSNELQQMVQSYLAQRWMPTYVNSYIVNGDIRFDVRFAPNPDNRSWQMRHNMMMFQFQEEGRLHVNQGLYLASHTSVRLNGVIYNAAIWMR